MEKRYIIESEERNKAAEKSLKKLGASNATINESYAFNLGIVMGGIIFMLALVLMFKEYNGIELSNNTIFTQRFPVWRGASYVMVYLWVLGLNVAFYESSQINYKLIFHFDT